MTNNDFELLQEYAQKDSEDSFAELVRRHLNMVYSAALRQVRSQQLAEEVAQSVFADLARNARRLAPGAIITAWLYQVTRRTAIDVIRRESRRQLREQIAAQMNAIHNTEAEWLQIEPLLDEAMESLDETDRAAILLRYFENKPLREVGVTLGISDDAAQKRVSRAVERLQEFFKQRGLGIGAAVLVVLISANAVQSAPIGLVLAISAAAATGTSLATTAMTAKTIATMTAMQKSIVLASLIVAAGMGIYTTGKTSQLRNQVKSLTGQQDALSTRLAQAEQERDASTNRLASLNQQLNELKSNQNSAELLRLRGEVSVLRKERQEQSRDKMALNTEDPATQSFLAARALAQKISDAFQQMPEKAIPELKLMTDVDWLSATKQASFDSDADTRKTLRNVRALAKKRLPLGGSLFSFTQANNGQLPSSLSQLKSYFLSQLNYSSRETAQLDDGTLDAILSRYELLHSGNVSDYPPGTWFIGEKSSVDKDYDSRAKFGNGMDTVIDTGLNENGDPDDPSY
ncbi:MAG TPA: sigma-70 family RNA polymerase sigma factor [Verrucomicrobiae bacterium]|jgi:RNA polymerase sigma factor (sigma-70 family)|nr:sigma-70 family RNA polymerase sigma factor [Verrucomicrobiae bacterium]